MYITIYIESNVRALPDVARARDEDRDARRAALAARFHGLGAGRWVPAHSRASGRETQGLPKICGRLHANILLNWNSTRPCPKKRRARRVHQRTRPEAPRRAAVSQLSLSEGETKMCKLCDEGKPQDHTGSQLGRRDFLKATAATGVAAAGLNLFAARPAAAQTSDPPADSGQPGTRY